jgi:RNA polymerase sigma-70 factor, ECF subfamily
MSAATLIDDRPCTVGPATMLDVETQSWIDRLDAGGAVREAAVADLHALLLRAARFEVGRRAATVPHLRGDDLDDMAHQCAADAVIAVLRKLDSFRGESRFTTWAYKFALYEAAVAVRRCAWQGREVPLEPDRWPLLRAVDPSPQQDAETAELLVAVREAIASELTPHQREVLIAVALNDVPIDVLAQRMTTTRGALYKTIHDARRKLRTALSAQGLEPGREAFTP